MDIRRSAAALLLVLVWALLIHALHEWAHVLAARLVCGCWGTTHFEGWTFCPGCSPQGHSLAFVYLAGPAVNFIFLALAFSFTSHSDPKKNALGFCWAFAALPLPRILAALAGGTDETAAFRTLFEKADRSNHHFVSLLGLGLILFFTIPPLLKLWLTWRPRRQLLYIFPLFLLLPMWADHVTVEGFMNKLLPPSFAWMAAWTILLMILAWMLNRLLFPDGFSRAKG